MTVTLYYDGSRHAEGALNYAAWASARLEQSVDLIYLIESTTSDPTVQLDRDAYGVMGAREDILRELSSIDQRSDPARAESGREMLQAAARRLRELGVPRVHTAIDHRELPDHVRNLPTSTDLAIIGKRGESHSAATQKLGENIVRALSVTSTPILVTTAEYRDIRNVLVAFDGRASTGSVRFLAESPLKDCAITLMLVGDHPEERMRLRDATRHLESIGLNVTSRILVGDVDKLIPREINSDEYDLLVLGAYSHSRLRKLVLGSTTDRLLRSSMKPMLVVR